MTTFRVGATAEFGPDGVLAGILEKYVEEILGPYSDISFELIRDHQPEVRSAQVRDFDAVITAEIPWPAESFNDTSSMSLVAFWGVGYDGIDVRAATTADVMVSLSTPTAVRWPVAESALGFMLALSKNLMVKSRLAREGRSEEKARFGGRLLRGSVVGLIGFGNIGTGVATLLPPFAPARILAYSPRTPEEQALKMGVALVDLPTLMRESDFVLVLCPLNDQTRLMIGEAELHLMKPSAYFINCARGGIVDQKALAHALAEHRIAGAALDVFDPEPPLVDDPLLAMENVIATPHCISWIDEAYRANNLANLHAVLDVYHGRVPERVANSEVLERPGLLAKLEKYASDHASTPLLRT